jgi:hypothetical protein
MSGMIPGGLIITLVNFFISNHTLFLVNSDSILWNGNYGCQSWLESIEVYFENRTVGFDLEHDLIWANCILHSRFGHNPKVPLFSGLAYICVILGLKVCFSMICLLRISTPLIADLFNSGIWQTGHRSNCVGPVRSTILLSRSSQLPY